MRALHFGPDGTLSWEDRPLHAPGPGEVAITPVASGLNRADLLQRAGLYPPPPGATHVPGLEVSGHVRALGDEVTGFEVGDPVVALLAGGGFAEDVICPAAQVLPAPTAIDVAHAAALPEVWATVWQNLVLNAGLSHGDRVLVHAGASGVGTAAIQLCRLFGARVWVTAGSTEKIERCVALGADGGSVRTAGSWRQDVAAWAPDGVDIVLDPVGGSAFEEHLHVLGQGGRLCVIGLMGGRAGRLDLGRLLVKNLKILGSTLRSQPVEVKGHILSGLADVVWPALARGQVRPVIDAVARRDDVEGAFQHLASNNTFGKVLLLW
jgi:putative PIG3 family NAD(P)H quinone oxidoreductase